MFSGRGPAGKKTEGTPRDAVLGAALYNLGAAAGSHDRRPSPRPGVTDNFELLGVAREYTEQALKEFADKHHEQIEGYKRSTEQLILERYYQLEKSIEHMLQEALAPAGHERIYASREPQRSPRGPRPAVDNEIPPDRPDIYVQVDKLVRAAGDVNDLDERCRSTEKSVFEGIKSMEATLEYEMKKQCDMIANLKNELTEKKQALSNEEKAKAEDLKILKASKSVVQTSENKRPRPHPSSVTFDEHHSACGEENQSLALGETATCLMNSVAQSAKTWGLSSSGLSPDHYRSKVIQGVSSEFAQCVGFHTVQEEEERSRPDIRIQETMRTRELFAFPKTEPKNQWHGRIQKVVHSALFVGVMEACIVTNVCIKAVQMDIDTRRAVSHEKPVPWGQHVDYFFTALFVLELMLRIAADQCWFFSGPHWSWNLFDLGVVACSVIEILTNGLSIGFLRIFRSLRLVRVLKIVRVFRFFRELRLMAVSIASCMVSLFWALVMIFMVVLVFAMFVLEGSKNYLLEGESQNHREDMATLYGSFPQAVYSLIQTISGGGDWGHFAAPLVEVSWVYGAGFAFFVSFVTLGMMNILIGIFVENAQSYSAIDRDLVIQEEMHHKESYMNQLRELFHEMDEDKSGTITYEEFNACMSHERAKAYLDFLQLNSSEAQGLFMLLDLDEKGEIGVEEFVLGCMRLKGTAKSIDAASMMFQTKRIAVKVNELAAYSHERLELLVSLAQLPKEGSL